MNEIKMKAGAIALCMVAVVASGAHARQSVDADAPIDLAADELETFSNQCLMIWRGNAEALQGQARLRADTLKAFAEVKGAPKPGSSTSANCGATERLEAVGNVFFVTGDRRIRGDNGVYDVAGETLTVTGDVIAVQGPNVLRGRRMVVNTRTGEAQMRSDVKGRNKPGRVRGVFFPKSQPRPS